MRLGRAYQVLVSINLLAELSTRSSVNVSQQADSWGTELARAKLCLLLTDRLTRCVTPGTANYLHNLSFQLPCLRPLPLPKGPNQV